MAFNVKYPLDISTIEGDGKQSGFQKIINEFVYLYSVVTQIVHSVLGHKHTGAVNDGPQLVTASYGDGTVTLVKLAEDVVFPTVAKGVPLSSGGAGVLMWTGTVASIAEIPSIYGVFHLCDGTNGTVDLRNRFVVGAGDIYAIGATGGESSHVLTVEEIPPHDHTWTLYGDTNLAGGYPTGEAPNAGISGTGTTNLIGGGIAHNNLPPYYSLCFIQRIS